MRCVLVVMFVATLWASGAHAERLRAPDGTVKEVPEQSVEFALRDGYTRIPKVDMRSPSGEHVLVDEDQVQAAIDQGFWKMTPSEVANENRNRLDRITQEVEDEEDNKRLTVYIFFALLIATVILIGVVTSRRKRR